MTNDIDDDNDVLLFGNDDIYHIINVCGKLFGLCVCVLFEVMTLNDWYQRISIPMVGRRILIVMMTVMTGWWR